MVRMRRRQSDAGIQLTPMIDVMTVLLAVFMVTTPMMTTGIDLELPRAGASAMTGNDHAIQISVDANGNYYLNEMKNEISVAITNRGKISVVTYDLFQDENGLYFEYGCEYRKINVNDFKEVK